MLHIKLTLAKQFFTIAPINRFEYIYMCTLIIFIILYIQIVFKIINIKHNKNFR